MNDVASGHNVIAVSFEDDGNAYRAMTALGEISKAAQPVTDRLSPSAAHQTDALIRVG
jgi:hypothetical protein